MRKLKQWFNSPLFVAALAVMAVGIIYINVVQPLMGGTPRSSAPPTTPAPAPTGPAMATNMTTNARAARPVSDNLAARHWIDLPERDPFRLTPISAPSMAAMPTAQESPDQPLRANQRFTLRAVLIEPGAKLAALGTTFVAEGDHISDYRVLKIEPDIVWLDGPLGKESIGFNDADATAQTNITPQGNVTR